MSSTNVPSGVSSAEYCAWPSFNRDASFIVICCTAANAPGPLNWISPIWLTSNNPTPVRTGVGLFDVSHMGEIQFRGPGALAAVQHITMNDASRLKDGQAQY